MQPVAAKKCFGRDSVAESCQRRHQRAAAAAGTHDAATAQLSVSTQSMTAAGRRLRHVTLRNPNTLLNCTDLVLSGERQVVLGDVTRRLQLMTSSSRLLSGQDVAVKATYEFSTSDSRNLRHQRQFLRFQNE
jgi:hypothetical protein